MNTEKIGSGRRMKTDTLFKPSSTPAATPVAASAATTTAEANRKHAATMPIGSDDLELVTPEETVPPPLADTDEEAPPTAEMAGLEEPSDETMQLDALTPEALNDDSSSDEDQ